MPSAPNKDSPCCKLPYFSREGWNNQEKGRAGKGGPQSENVGLQFAEEADGRPVTYTVAKEMRAMLNSLFHSLLANGQAAEVSNSLTHEARVYIHVTMANHFPLLLFCEGGRWKIDLMITQAYSGFWTNHGHKAVKKEPANVDMDALPSKVVVKRERHTNDTAASNVDEGPNKKKARLAKSTLATAPITIAPVSIITLPPLHAHTAPTTPAISSPSRHIILSPLALSVTLESAILTQPQTAQEIAQVDAALPSPQTSMPTTGQTPIVEAVAGLSIALSLTTTSAETPAPNTPVPDKVYTAFSTVTIILIIIHRSF